MIISKQNKRNRFRVTGALLRGADVPNYTDLADMIRESHFGTWPLGGLYLVVELG